MNPADVPEEQSYCSQRFPVGTRVVVTAAGCGVPVGTEGKVSSRAGETSAYWVRFAGGLRWIDSRDLRLALHYQDEE